jgi:tetratricopeptide (TPR) repeat protein
MNTLNSRLPTIVLGHHGLGCFTRDERERITEIFYHNNVRLYLCGDEHVGGIDVFDTTLQLTAGCLNQSEKGIEPTFYIGDMDHNGSFEVKAYTYQSGAYTGWTLCEPICDKISKWTSQAFPHPVSSIFGRDEKIREIASFLSTPHGKIAEVWGVAGIGKTTVCHEVLKRLAMAYISVDTRLYSTAIEIQRDILRQLGVDVDQANFNPNDYGTILLNEAKLTRKTLYLDNAETPIVKDRDSFSAWLFRYARESGWRVLYSTQIQLDAEYIEPFSLKPLPEDDAFDMFVSRRWKTKSHKELSDADRQLAWEIAVEMLSRHPLAIVIATSSKQNKRSLYELKNDLQRRILHQFSDDPDNPHRSMSAALSLTVSGIESSMVSAQAKVLWSMLAQYRGEFSDDLFSLAYGDQPEYSEARLLLRDFALIDEHDYTMLEPIKAEACNFNTEEKKTSRSVLFRALSTLFDKGCDRNSPGRQKWHDISLLCLQPALLLLAESGHDDFDMIRSLVYSAHNYFQFSSYTSLETLRKLEQLYRAERANLDLAIVLRAMGDLECRLGYIDAAQKHYTDAEQLCRAERYNLGLANVLKAMGDLECWLGYIDAAQKHYTDAEQLYRAERHNLGLANVFRAMGNLESRLGDIDAAQKHYADAEQIYRAERANLGLANVLHVMGELESRLGDIDAAQKHYADADQLYRAERYKLGLANVLNAMGDMESRLGDIDAAISRYLIALGIYDREQEPMGRIFCMARLCRAYAIKKDVPHFLEYTEATVNALGSVSENVAGYAIAFVREAMSIMGISPLGGTDEQKRVENDAL